MVTGSVHSEGHLPTSTAASAVVHPWAAEAADRHRFGIETVAFAPWPVLRAFGQAVDDLGFDSLWLSDHPMLAGSATWTHLAALADATRRVRLGPLVACVSYTNPVVTARAAADLDLISGGRAVLGVGSGNGPGEFAQLGVPWQPAKQRQAELEEALRIIGPLLRGETVTVTTGRFRPTGAALAPLPVQRPYIPILIGGGGEQTTLRFAGHYADASNLGPLSRAADGLSPDVISRKLAVLDGHVAEAERPAGSVLRTGLLAAYLSADPAAVLAKRALLSPEMVGLFQQLPFVETVEAIVLQVQALLSAGMRYVIFVVIPGDVETLQLLAAQVIPVVAASSPNSGPDPVAGA